MRANGSRFSMAILGAVIAILVLIPATASAHKWMASGQWVHQHSRYYYVFNNVADSSWWQETRNAQLEWHGDVRLDLSSTNHDNARIHAWDGNWGSTGWVGLAESAYHTTHSHVKLNLTYRPGTVGQRAVSCQEIGHALGLDHASAGDCMGYGYYSGSNQYVGSHSINDINGYYAASH